MTDALAAVRARHERAEQDKQPLWAQTHADRALLLAEIDRLRECLEPGKASAIVAGMFEVAIRHGHSPYSSKHALTFLDKEILRLRARVAEVEGERDEAKARIEKVAAWWGLIQGDRIYAGHSASLAHNHIDEALAGVSAESRWEQIIADKDQLQARLTAADARAGRLREALENVGRSYHVAKEHHLAGEFQDCTSPICEYSRSALADVEGANAVLGAELDTARGQAADAEAECGRLRGRVERADAVVLAKLTAHEKNCGPNITPHFCDYFGVVDIREIAAALASDAP